MGKTSVEPSVESEDDSLPQVWSIYIPTWVRISLFIFTVSAVSIAGLMLIASIKAWSYGSNLMKLRLANYAVMKSIEVEQDLNDVESVLAVGLSRGVVTETMNSRNLGNVTDSQWNSLISQIEKGFDSSTIYDSMVLYDARGSQVYSYLKTGMNLTVSQELLPLSTSNSLAFQQFQDENITVIIRDPVSIQAHSNDSVEYLYSMTMPINYQTNDVSKNTLTTRIVGYATTVLRANAANDLGEGGNEFFGHSFVSLVRLNSDAVEWTYVLPSSRLSSTDDAGRVLSTTDGIPWYGIKEYPAITMAASLRQFHTEKPRGTVMRTYSPRLQAASVGYSYVDLGDHKWFMLVEIAQSTAFHDLYHLRNVLVGACFGILAAVFFAVVPLTRAQTRSFYRIYQGMEFRPQISRINGAPANSTKFAPKVEVFTRSNTASSVDTSILDSGLDTGFDTNQDKSNKKDDSDYTDLTETPQIPSRLQPLHRWYKDELDELVTEYNKMVDKLDQQYFNLEDEVRARTKESQNARLLAEAANRAKTLFIANITHELRTPLNGIMGMTMVTAYEHDREKVIASLQTIIDSGRALMELLNELLSFSHSQLGITPEPVEFMVQNLFDSLDHARKDSDIGVVMTPLPTHLATVTLRGDLFRIHQVVTNILSNAFKFSEHNDRVSVHVGLRTEFDRFISMESYSAKSPLVVPQGSDGRPAGPPVVLEVQVIDTGLGISSKELARIFDMFSQGDETLSKRHRGAGIGMSMSKQLAEGIGGYVLVTSEVSQGTTVVLRVPVQCMVENIDLKALHPPAIKLGMKNCYSTTSVQAGTVFPGFRDPADAEFEGPEFEPPTTFEAHHHQQNFKVLVVDDNELNRTILQRLLAQLGVDEVDLAGDGRTAIQHVERSIVDGVFYGVIFMDLEMPGINGLEATAVIRSTLGYPYPIVALTGYSDNTTLQTCQDANIQEVLTKPVLKQDLSNTLNRYKF